MSFGKNPYIAKAQAAELKAEESLDDGARERARREAAHEWERAAARETPGKRRTEYLENAERNRRLAENEELDLDQDAPTDVAPERAAKPLLN
jgi:hypothetical protein